MACFLIVDSSGGCNKTQRGNQQHQSEPRVCVCCFYTDDSKMESVTVYRYLQYEDGDFVPFYLFICMKYSQSCIQQPQRTRFLRYISLFFPFLTVIDFSSYTSGGNHTFSLSYSTNPANLSYCRL